MFTFGNNGRFQTLFRESVTFSNFEKKNYAYVIPYQKLAISRKF